MKNILDRTSSAPRFSLDSRSSKKWVAGLFLSSLTVVAIAHAGVSTIGTSNSSFLAVGPAGLKIEGKGKGIATTEKGGTIRVEVPLKTMTTGISLRDKHLYDALKTQKYPKAVLEVKRSSLKFPDNDKTVESGAKGSFTIHGKTTTVPFKYKAKRTGSDYHVQAKVTIDITKFNMEIPCYLGVCVDKNVKVKVKFKVRDK